jgi:hypothetical protein
MGRYSPSGQSLPAPHKRGIHPLMRGIGCIMIVVVPILAYGVAMLLVNYGIRQGWPIPPDWLGTPTFHPLLWRLAGVAVILDFLSRQTHLTANIIFAIAITIVIGGIMSMIYGYIYALFGPPQYGPTDEPPLRIKVKRYKR